MKAHCDIQTGMIYGCEKYSFKWFHEEGHLKFNSNEKTSFLIMIQSYAFDIWMIFIMLSLVSSKFIPLVGMSWLVYISIMLYEEHWCNNYAKVKLSEKYINSN